MPSLIRRNGLALLDSSYTENSTQHDEEIFHQGSQDHEGIK